MPSTSTRRALEKLARSTSFLAYNNACPPATTSSSCDSLDNAVHGLKAMALIHLANGNIRDDMAAWASFQEIVKKLKVTL